MILSTVYYHQNERRIQAVMTEPTEPITVAVIGGGAAGFFAAVNLARFAHENGLDVAVTIFEASAKPLQKVFISGGGRCNVTHSCFDPVQLVQHYPRGSKALRSLFHRFQPQDTIDWFQQRGLTLKTEPDGRLFPVTDTSQDVIDVLMHEANQYDVTLNLRSRVTFIQKEDNGYSVTWQTSTQTESSQPFDKVILATGYSPVGWQMAQSLGHTILKPVPSLFPFKVDSPAIEGLQGISRKEIRGKLKLNTTQVEAVGDLLITHTGLSGPLIYRLSALAARPLAEMAYQADLILNLIPDNPQHELQRLLWHSCQTEWSKKQLKNVSFQNIPKRWWETLLRFSGLDPNLRGEEIPKKPLNRLAENLTSLTLSVIGKSPSKEEFVSCGGVALNEVDFKTMESKLNPGLYLGGEILDIDGLTGGFNFQACWSAGYVLAMAMADAISPNKNPSESTPA
ncbi:MAG: NAD(P)/FAD-dependent oxidoreductase [Vampirovibrio sp.]|nr:NAD(P)/FAD-dependent oxidoreductase [Vampirovibrio sp.]